MLAYAKITFMKIKLNYIIIPLVVIAVAIIGSYFTTPNIESWYNFLTLPGIAPSGQVIGVVWTVLYVLIAASGLLFWNKSEKDKYFSLIVGIFLANAVLNAFWSYVFFSLNEIGWAVVVSAAMAITIYLLITLLYKRQKVASILLIPYALWVSFATYLNYLIWTLNS